MESITGVILAGGQSRRMGGEDKGLLLLHGKPLYQYVLQRLQPQVNRVIISANRHQDQYALSGCTIVADTLPGYQGPLAGMLAALIQAESEWVVFCACDTPFIPADYVCRLWAQRNNARAVWVRSEQRDHPALALLHVSLAQQLSDSLAMGERRVMHFLSGTGHAVLFAEDEQVFANLNTPEDLRNLEERA